MQFDACQHTRQDREFVSLVEWIRTITAEDLFLVEPLQTIFLVAARTSAKSPVKKLADAAAFHGCP